MNWLSWALQNYGTVSLILGAIIAFFTKGRRFINNAIRTYVLGNRFHDIFGDTPADFIKEIHETIQKSHDVLEIRQQISEKYLKIGIYICQLDGKLTWSNECLNNMFGLDSEDMKGFGWLQSVSSHDRKRIHEAWMYCIHEQIAYNEKYIIINHRDQLVFDVCTHAVAVIDDQKNIQCYVGYLVVNKVTKNKTGEQDETK